MMPTSNVTIGQWSTYENPEFGISVDHPANWNLDLPEAFIGLPGDPRTVFNVVESPSRWASLGITVENTSSFLDTDTMQVKNNTLEDYVGARRSQITSSTLAGVTGELSATEKYLKDNKTTVAGNPAWKIESIINGRYGDTYIINTYMIDGNKLYTFNFQGDALKAPEMIPIAQRMIDSFKVSTPQPPVSTPNVTETADSLPSDPFSSPPPFEVPSSESPSAPPEEEDTTQNDGENEDDQSTDEDDNNDSEEDEEN
jgi:hypothetical protein